MVPQRISVSGLTGGIFAPPIGNPPQVLPFCVHRHPHFGGHKLHGRRRISLVEALRQGTPCTLQLDVPTGPVLEACSPEAADTLRADLLLVQEEINNGVVPSRTKADECCFQKWEIFFRAHNMDTFLDKVRALVLFLQLFILRVRSGLLAHNGESVRSRTAEAYLWAVGKTFANVIIEDPRLNKHGSIDHCLQRQLRGWEN